MRRVILFLAAAVLALGLAAPAVLAAQPTFDHTGTVSDGVQWGRHRAGR